MDVCATFEKLTHRPYKLELEALSFEEQRILQLLLDAATSPDGSVSVSLPSRGIRKTFCFQNGREVS